MVYGGTRPYENRGTGWYYCMYWHVLILTIQSGYAALLLDSLLQFCPAYSTVLETTASNHTNASSRMFQSTAAGPASNLVTSLPLLAGDVGSAGFSRGAADSAAGAGGSAGTAAVASAGARWRWRWCRQRVLAWDHWWVGHGSSLGDELAGQVLGSWTSPAQDCLRILSYNAVRESQSSVQNSSGAWHQIFHITISPWFLLIDHIDEFNLIVFHPTIKIT
jgi:hypothetical protein